MRASGWRRRGARDWIRGERVQYRGEHGRKRNGVPRCHRKGLGAVASTRARRRAAPSEDRGVTQFPQALCRRLRAPPAGRRRPRCRRVRGGGARKPGGGYALELGCPALFPRPHRARAPAERTRGPCARQLDHGPRPHAPLSPKPLSRRPLLLPVVSPRPFAFEQQR